MNLSTSVHDIYRSRVHILEILSRQGYNIDDYDYFTIGEVSTMQTIKQLDMFKDTSRCLNSSVKTTNSYCSTEALITVLTTNWVKTVAL